jgi:hypothetical protein
LDLPSTGARLLALAESSLIGIFCGVTGPIRNSGALGPDSVAENRAGFYTAFDRWCESR